MENVQRLDDSRDLQKQQIPKVESISIRKNALR